MSELKSMQIEPAKDSDFNNGSLVVSKKPQFPPGLEITLRNEELKKLGFSDDREMPQIDQRMLLTAMVEVVGIDSEDIDGRKDRRVRLQLQEMKVESKPALDRSAAETLFGPQHR